MAAVIGWVALAAVVITLVTNLLGMRKLHTGQQEIHVLVNSKLDAALARGLQLADELKAHDIEVPAAEPNG